MESKLSNVKWHELAELDDHEIEAVKTEAVIKIANTLVEISKKLDKLKDIEGSVDALSDTVSAK